MFVGVNYYGRLKHMVADKAQARAGGRMNAITRQPAKSGGRSGGMRIGEMEQNAVVAHGMVSFLKESFLERSDGHVMAIDADEGVPAVRGLPTPLAYPGAGVDGGPPRFADVEVPYAFKLLGQELATMALDVVLEVDASDDEEPEPPREAEGAGAGPGADEGSEDGQGDGGDDGDADVDVAELDEQVMASSEDV